MKTLAFLLVAALALAACAPLSALAGGDGIGKQVLTNLEGCERHYTGALGAGVTGSFEITCHAQPAGVAAGGITPAPDLKP